MRHARHLSAPSSGLEAPPWPSARRGRHFLDASPVEEMSTLARKVRPPLRRLAEDRGLAQDRRFGAGNGP